MKTSRYSHQKGARKPARSKISLFVAFLLLGGGVYLFILALSPRFLNSPNIDRAEVIQEAKQASPTHEDSVIIPKIGVDIAYASGGEEQLNEGAWWRHAERGNPQAGGNMILSAHRFQIGLTPAGTAKKSPFYRIDKLLVGDEIFIWYKDQLYRYEVESRTVVEPTAVEIEDPSEDHKLTLYSCTFGGSYDGREVVIARQKEIITSQRNADTPVGAPATTEINN